jgi:hypothetical protein
MATLVSMLAYINDFIPCIMPKGKQRVYCACFPDKLADPARLVLNLKDILNVEGLLATSEKHLLRTIGYCRKRLETEESVLQQEYRDAFQLCLKFINQNDTLRSEDEWLQFITNCVYMYALRNVLHKKPLPNEDRNIELDQELEVMIKRIYPNITRR